MKEEYYYFMSFYYAQQPYTVFGLDVSVQDHKVCVADIPAWAEHIKQERNYDHAPTILFFKEIDE